MKDVTVSFECPTYDAVLLMVMAEILDVHHGHQKNFGPVVLENFGLLMDTLADVVEQIEEESAGCYDMKGGAIGALLKYAKDFEA